MKTPEYRIAIVGAGKTGRDLFDLLTGFPFHITLVCRKEAVAEALIKNFEKKQKRTLKYQLADQAAYDFRTNNTLITTGINHLDSCDLVIETITENPDMKKALFHQIEDEVSAQCVIASNTSSIPPDVLFSEMALPERCLGLHFFFPAGHIDVVEMNVAENTSKRTIEFVSHLLGMMGRFFVVLREPHHFLVNRMLLKMQATCCRMVRSGLAEAGEVDAMVMENLFPAGIFNFFDHVGNDVMLQSVRNYVQHVEDLEFYNDILYMLEEKVKAGKLGVKAGAGFYSYPDGKMHGTKGGEGKVKLRREIINYYLRGIFEAHEKTGLSKRVIEHIVKQYLMVEKSPFDLAVECGYNHK